MDTKHTSKTVADQVPSSHSGIQKSGITKPVTQENVDYKKVKTDFELLASLKKPEVQELLSGFRESANSALPLSYFKTPRENNQDTELRKASSSSKKPVPPSSLSNNKVENTKKAYKETSDTICNANQIIQNRKRTFRDVGVTKEMANIETSVNNQTTNLIETSVLRPTLKAKRSLLVSLPSAPSHISSPTAIPNVDIPQRTLLIASRNKYKSRPQGFSKSVDSQARPAESQTIFTDNEISGILQINKTDETNVCVQLDTTDAMNADVIKAANTAVRELMIVVDTNVWIGNQLLIEELLEIDFQVLTRSIKATLIIPWMVLQEIDQNKTSINGFKFRGASKFIHGLLSKKHPRVKGELSEDAVIGNGFTELMADDSILSCAIKRSKLTQVKTVMLTNDINLLNKALIHGLDAFKADNDLINNLRQCLNDTDVKVCNLLDDTEILCQLLTLQPLRLS